MNYKAEIKQLKEKIHDLKWRQEWTEKHCPHEWGETEHKIINEKDKWTRECKLCGKVETATKQVPVDYVPDFK